MYCENLSFPRTESGAGSQAGDREFKQGPRDVPRFWREAMEALGPTGQILNGLTSLVFSLGYFFDISQEILVWQCQTHHHYKCAPDAVEAPAL